MSKLTRVRARTAVDDTAPAALPQFRRQLLRDSLLPTVELLEQRDVGQVGNGFIADYLALDWLRWDGGSLQLTVTGKDVCDQVLACVD